MEKIDLDKIGVYAFADKSHARDRELWRGFLCYALPTLFGKTMDDIEVMIAKAIVHQLEELTEKKPNENEDYYLRVISMKLAKEIGVSPEFGLSAFFEGDLPTKTFAVKLTSPKYKRKSKKKNFNHEDAMIGTWLSHLAQIQSDARFMQKAEEWRGYLFPKEMPIHVAS